MASNKTKNRRSAAALGVVAAGMVGLAFASVPLYQLFCKITGYAGTPRIDANAGRGAVSSKTLDVRFDANTDPHIPWGFKAEQLALTVKMGEPTLAFYRAHNNSNETITGTAVFNVTPFKAAPYFSKIQCFCFTEQTLKPGESVDMPVEFVVDPEILKDPNTSEIKAITLSYTFYRAETDGKSKTPETAEYRDAAKGKIKG